MTYEEFEASIRLISNQIIESGFQPDVIIAIARGGWVPARILSKFLSVKKLSSIGISYVDNDRSILTLYDSPYPQIRNQKILLVEDYLESAKSMRFGAKELRQLNNEVKTFALGYSDQSILIPDYSLGIVSRIPELAWD